MRDRTGGLRRPLRVAALVVVVASAYAGGVVTGTLRSDDDDAARGHHGVIDEAADRIVTRSASAVDREELERAAVEGMLSALGDRWSSYYRPAEFRDFQSALEGSYTGVGLWLRTTPKGAIEVGSVQSDSPASRGGLAAGDRIIAIDGNELIGRPLAAVVSMLRGDEGTAVQVTLRHNAQVRTVKLVRAPVETEDVTVQSLRGGLLRVRVAAFTRGVGREVREALDTDPAVRRTGVVLDLRDNPGGLLDEAVEVASVFLEGGPVVTYERRGEQPRTLSALGRGDVSTPVVVLIDSGTASAAEVVAAALQDRNRAVIVGSRTYGKGSVQEPTRLSDGSAIELTVGRYRTPRGRVIDGVGVEPDVEVPAGSQPAVAERRAAEVLSGLLAALSSTGRG
jgi:carboxyl-terminal processing protease